MAVSKLHLARVFDTLGLNAAGLAAQRVFRSPWARAVNYHDVPPEMTDAFDQQLQFYGDHFECLDLERLTALIEGSWRPRRPGIVLTFDDGLRSHAEVVAPLLERRGLVGWFMVPAGFVDEPPQQQAAFARDHQIGYHSHDYGDPRVALSWDEVRHVGRRHVIGCHTQTHRRLFASLTRSELEREIPGAKARLESQLGYEIPVFAWVGGEEPSYSRAAAQVIAETGFHLGFMTNHQLIRRGLDRLQIQRSNVEASDSLAVMRFQLSGVMDWVYRSKRERVNALTRVQAR